jgi:hypothetical protein
LDRHWATLGTSVTNTTGDRHDVLLELHPSTPANSETPTRQIAVYVRGRNLDTCGHTLNDRDESRPV